MISVEDYKKMSEEVRMELIHTARQEERFRKPLVIEGLSFSEEGWLKFTAIEIQSGWFGNSEHQIELQTYREKSKQKVIRAVVTIFHGMTSHTNEGAYVAKRLSERGYEVVGFDQRGFGKSGGLRGYIKEFATIEDDSHRFIELVRNHYPDKQLFTLGLSLGGLTSYSLGLNNPEIAGCILMAPALRTFYNRGSYYFARTFGWMCPNTKIPKVGRGGKRGSKNPNVTELRREDPLRYTQNPYVRSLSSLLHGVDTYVQTYERFASPVLIIQGLRDNSLHPMGAVEFYERCSSTDKSIKLYPQLWHNIWLEEQIHEIMDGVVEWLDERTRA